MELFPHSTMICLWNRVSVTFSWQVGSKVCVLMTEQGWSRQEFQPHVYYPVCLISTCSHPNSWLLFNCLSFLAEFFSREAPLCTQPCPASLTSWSSWIWLGKEREGRLEGGGEQGQSFLPWLPPHFCLVRVMARCYSRRASWRSVFFRVSHSLLHSVSTVTPLTSRPRVVSVPALASAWTLTLLLASFHLACLSESSCSSDLSIVKSLLVCMLSGTFNGEKNP